MIDITLLKKDIWKYTEYLEKGEGKREGDYRRKADDDYTEEWFDLIVMTRKRDDYDYLMEDG